MILRRWGVWLPRHIWDVENSQVRILSPQPHFIIGDLKMTNQEKIAKNNVRINILRERGETMNMRIINKLIRKNRALEKQA